MTKMVNKTFTKPKRVEDVSLAKSGLLDEIKDETSEDGCSSVRSDLQEDQEASSVESGHRVFCDTKGKEIELRQEVMRDDLQGGSWSRRRHMKVARSSTEVGREVARQVHQIVMQYLLFRCNRGCVMIIHEEADSWIMHISWGRKAWCGAHLVGEKSTFGVKVSRLCGVKVFELESRRLGEQESILEIWTQVYDLKEEE
ncbi:hypothetical protein DY000_02005283 [Brassica cretica]|uniref:DUF4283 domain-containing protein n=1 Tax=Brassica cretica TaxID=69181 RepID=A0ABQ7BUA9_BRACR|nr:hypothetical protein DY000_02005283 [Brassica cretica]